MSSLSADERLYVASKSGNGIYVADFDEANGQPGSFRLAGAAEHPSFLATTSDHRFLYAMLETPPHERVAAYAVQPDGLLRFLNAQPTGQSGGCHVSLSHDDRLLFSANYGTASYQGFPLDPSHFISACTALVPLIGSGPNLQRQKSAHGHSIYADPAGRFIYACDLGSDKIWIFKGEPASEKLVPNDPAFALADPGSGPRHLAFGGGGKWVYVANEMGVSVTAFARDPITGALRKRETQSCLPPNASADSIATAEIYCHPSGRWLYVSNRDNSKKGGDTISVFALGSEGELALIQNLSAGVHSPRSFALDATGRWLVGAGENDNQLAIFKIDSDRGTLTLARQINGVPNPSCVIFGPALSVPPSSGSASSD